MKLRTKIMVLFCLLLLAVGSVIVILSSETATDLIKQSIGLQAKKVSETAAKQINRTVLAEILKQIETGLTTQQQQSRILEMPEFNSIREKLVEIKKINGLKYLYLLAKGADNTLIYLVDGMPLDDPNISLPGDGVEEDREIVRKVFDTGRTAIGALSISKEWGALLTSYVPVTDSSGTVVGVVGADFDATQIYDIINRNRLTWVWILLASLLLAGLGSYWISGTLVKPLLKLTSNMDKLRNGDLTVEFTSKGKDEIAQLNQAFKAMVNDMQATAEVARKIAAGDLEVEVTPKSGQDILSLSMKQMVEMLRSLIAEAADLTQAARGGRLSVRGKAENFQGAFADIISGVNKTLDAVIYPLNVAAEYIRQIGEGNIPEPIIEMYEGDFAVIKNDLNACIAAVNALISDVNDLTWSAKEGKLDIRADITRHKGDFCKIVNGINQTLDAIVGPLNDAGAVLNRMGVNDFSVAMEPEIYQGMLRTLAEEINRVRISLLNVQDAMVRVAQGDTSRLAEVKTIGKRSEYDHLNPALTGMMQAIEDLVDEATRITQAAVCGDLQLRGDVRKFTGGYLQIVAGFNHALDAMIEPIDEAARVLHEMAQGNLQQSMTGDYKGAYARIQENLNYTLAVFNDVLSNMDMVANQVAQAAYQVAESSQVLTREATLQADVVQELSVSMEQIAFQTKQNALNANQANHLAVDAQTIGMTGDSRMKELLQAMAEINEASGRISQIIKVINEIAFQTNVLALNASVEAARAGQYGRGFAVVAGEVRNLASRSAQASKETTTLIEGTIGKVATGTEIVKETAEALTRILENSEQTSERIQSIAKASSEQDSGITQLALGIEQVNRAIQHNTTTSQENAAASEKLSNQADQLRAMVRRFKLNSQAESMLPDKRL